MKVHLAGKQTAKELQAMGIEAQAALDRTVEMMQRFGTYALGMPHVRKLHGTPLWEIRIKDSAGIVRVIFVSEQASEIILLHAFRKKTQKTPQQAIALALQRLKEL